MHKYTDCPSANAVHQKTWPFWLLFGIYASAASAMDHRHLFYPWCHESCLKNPVSVRCLFFGLGIASGPCSGHGSIDSPSGPASAAIDSSTATTTILEAGAIGSAAVPLPLAMLFLFFVCELIVTFQRPLPGTRTNSSEDFFKPLRNNIVRSHLLPPIKQKSTSRAPEAFNHHRALAMVLSPSSQQVTALDTCLVGHTLVEHQGKVINFRKHFYLPEVEPYQRYE